MKVSNKWKLFALLHILSDWEGDGIALYDALDNGEDLAGVFEKHNVSPWYPFEYMDSDNPEYLASAIIGLAQGAQQTEMETEEVTNGKT